MRIDKLEEICKKNNYGFSISGKDPKLVLVGEPHNEEGLDSQEQIIEVVSPKVILHEGADRLLDYRPHTKRILAWEKKYGVPVELCDVPNQNNLNPSISKDRLERSFINLLQDFGFKGDYRLYSDMTNPLRERYMAAIIESSINQGKLPLIAVVGGFHVMPHSKIHSYLRDNEISYVTIVQQPQVQQVLKEDANFFRNL